MKTSEEPSSTQQICDNDKQEESDPALDLSSEQFDAFKSLYSVHVKVPLLNVPVYDNLAKYRSATLFLGEFSKEKCSEPVPKEAPKNVRKFLPHQMPVPAKPRVALSNIFSKMLEFKGPLQFLQRCVEEGLQVKVYTRHSHNLRGHCTGFLVAFDKHWNLALKNCHEVWTRSKKTKVPAFDCSGQVSSFYGATDQQVPPPIRPPDIRILKSDKKTETCERRVPQMILRGEQVAFVSVAERIATVNTTCAGVV